MIISHGRRFIFVHIPKTGGTSMALALEARAMKDDIMLGDTPKAVRRRRRVRNTPSRGRLWKHSTLADIDGLVTAADLDKLYCFTMVRNPWDRMVSYYHWLQIQSFDHPSVALAQRLAFRDFVRHPLTVGSFRNAPLRHYMTDASGIERVQAVVRLEHLDADLAPVETHLGFALDLPNSNQSPHGRDYRVYYDTRSAESVAETCAEDVKRFNYRFE